MPLLTFCDFEDIIPRGEKVQFLCQPLECTLSIPMDNLILAAARLSFFFYVQLEQMGAMGTQKTLVNSFFPWSTRNNNDRGMRNGCIQLHGLIFIQLLLPFSMLLFDVFFIPFWAVWVMLCLILLVMVTGSLKNGPRAKCIKMCVHCVMHVRVPMGIFFTWVLFLSRSLLLGID